MFEKEPSSKDFNCTQGRIIVTTSEVLTKEEITELKEIYENRLDTDHKSEKFDMSLLIKMFYENEQIQQSYGCDVYST